MQITERGDVMTIVEGRPWPFIVFAGASIVVVALVFAAAAIHEPSARIAGLSALAGLLIAGARYGGAFSARAAAKLDRRTGELQLTRARGLRTERRALALGAIDAVALHETAAHPYDGRPGWRPALRLGAETWPLAVSLDDDRARAAAQVDQIRRFLATAPP